jgi:hypothetical protein
MLEIRLEGSGRKSMPKCGLLSQVEFILFPRWGIDLQGAAQIFFLKLDPYAPPV